MLRRFALQQIRLNVPALNNLRPDFIVGLGKFCGPFCTPLIEFTGRPLLLRAPHWHPNCIHELQSAVPEGTCDFMDMLGGPVRRLALHVTPFVSEALAMRERKFPTGHILRLGLCEVLQKALKKYEKL
jgi:hypothetical protein